jgi:hypothetical protein
MQLMQQLLEPKQQFLLHSETYLIQAQNLVIENQVDMSDF